VQFPMSSKLFNLNPIRRHCHIVLRPPRSQLPN